MTWAAGNLINDRGKCFIADFTKEVVRVMEMDHKKTNTYHPYANGLVERKNHTLGDILSMCINSVHMNWDDILSYITFAYNSSTKNSRNKSTLERANI